MKIGTSLYVSICNEILRGLKYFFWRGGGAFIIAGLYMYERLEWATLSEFNMQKYAMYAK